MENNIGAWYWFHGRIGDYSILWFDFLSKNYTENVSAYVAKDGIVLTETCAPGSIKVRPHGGDETFPPRLAGGWPTGYVVDVDLGLEGTLNATFTSNYHVQDSSAYIQFAGTLNGSINGGEMMAGAAICEQFKLL